MPDKWQVRLIQLLAVPGLLVAGYLWLYHNGAIASVCTPGGWEDCGLVSGPDAPYASLGPIPVALIGFVGYAIIFLTTWVADWLPLVRRNLSELLVGLTGMALVFTLGLTALELFVIHAVCRFCLLSAAIIVVMFILAAGYLRTAVQSDRSSAGSAADEIDARQEFDVA